MNWKCFETEYVHEIDSVVPIGFDDTVTILFFIQISQLQYWMQIFVSCETDPLNLFQNS